jgi:glycosyltransferase involved in cell wall biosynthesis
VHACYRDSHAATGVVAAMLAFHRALGTWGLVDLYVALTEFSRRKFIEGGFPAEKIMVKPNFVYPDPGTGEGKGGYALFVGRLSPEKGVRTLLKAWRLFDGRIPLKIVGDGPMADEVADAAAGLRRVECLGRRSHDEVYALMGKATCLIFPSEWYEGFPLTIAEAFACGVPVITSRLGAMAEIVENERTGLLFDAGNPQDLAAKVDWAWSHPREMERMSQEARNQYATKYTVGRNYQMIMDIYHTAIDRARERAH